MTTVIEILGKGINESLVKDLKLILNFNSSDLEDPTHHLNYIRQLRTQANSMCKKYSMEINSVYAHFIFTLFNYFDVGAQRSIFYAAISAFPPKFKTMYEQFAASYSEDDTMQTGSSYYAPTPITYHLYRNPCIFPH